MLKTGGMAALGLGLGACAGKSPESPPVAMQGPRPRPATDLIPVNASWDRVIHTTVGLRPFRNSGFVVKPEKLDRKTVIHNYGHGGGGMSLAWGTGYLAAEMALSHGSRRAAVIGCGVVGLCTARQLQRRGYDVTIYAKNVPPHTTSNMSLAYWSPSARAVSASGRTPQWDEQFRFAAEIAYRELQLLAGRDYGIRWSDVYAPAEEPPPERIQNARRLMPEHLMGGREILGLGEHPFALPYAVRRRHMRIEPAAYLDKLVADVRLFGGRIVIRDFQTRRDLASLSELLIFNCSGLGAKEIFDDDELTPVKGQLTLLAPQPEVTYETTGIGLHMTPRPDGIALGNTGDRDVWSLDVNPDERKRVVDAHIELFSTMRAPWRRT